jgi:Ni/Co efflux regulator RcnB
MQSAKILTSLMLAVSALAPLASHAQDRDHGRRWDRDHRYEQRDRGDRDRDDRGDRVDIERRADRMAWHRWNRGERIPPEYRDRQYMIDDWRAHRLAPPPRGYHWVGVGGDYYLVRPDGFVFNVTIGG